MIGLICIDVDGTLVGSDNQVRQDVWAALSAARERGVRLALCSGRPAFGAARAYAERMDADGWHVFQNGASVVKVGSGESLSSAFPAAELAELRQQAERHALLLEIYTDTAYASTRRDAEAEAHAELLGVPYPPLWPDELSGEVVRTQWLIRHGQFGQVQALTPKSLSLHPAGSPRMTETLFVSMTAQGISKGSAIRCIAEDYGVPLADTLMIGDGTNDLEAMAAVGHAIAMGNAEEPVKQAAQHTVGHVDAGGLIEALQLAERL